MGTKLRSQDELDLDFLLTSGDGEAHLDIDLFKSYDDEIEALLEDRSSEPDPEDMGRWCFGPKVLSWQPPQQPTTFPRFLLLHMCSLNSCVAALYESSCCMIDHRGGVADDQAPDGLPYALTAQEVESVIEVMHDLCTRTIVFSTLLQLLFEISQ